MLTHDCHTVSWWSDVESFNPGPGSGPGLGMMMMVRQEAVFQHPGLR